MPSEGIKKHIEASEKPLISIITPLYNAAPFISETIKSVQAQTYTNWEQIIVDDHSTDTSLAVVTPILREDARIRLEALPENRGAAYCRNRATQLARGDYIAFLDADDCWHPEKLEKQLAFMTEHDCDVSYTSYLHMDEQGNALGKRILAIPELSYSKQHWNNFIGNLTGMYHAARIGKIEAPNIRKRQDWAVWLEAIRRSGRPALGLQDDLAYYRVRPDSVSSGKWSLIAYNFRFYRSHLGYPWLRSVYCMFRFFLAYFLIRPRYIERL